MCFGGFPLAELIVQQDKLPQLEFKFNLYSCLVTATFPGNEFGLVTACLTLRDPGADSGGEGKSKRAEKNGGKNGEVGTCASVNNLVVPLGYPQQLRKIQGGIWTTLTKPNLEILLSPLL